MPLVFAQLIPEGAGQGGGLGVQTERAFGRAGSGWPAAILFKCLKLLFLLRGRQLGQAGDLLPGEPAK